MGKMRPKTGERIPLLYLFMRRLTRLAIAIFFQKIELRHKENVPEAWPVVFAANHPNSTMDALVLSAVAGRMVHYIAHAGLFANRLKGRLLSRCGVIPVLYRTPKANKVERNVEAFQSCYEVLEEGGAIGIFPEGISDMARQVKKIKTGAARIVLEAERRNSYGLGVKVIPVGIYFFSRSRFRSRVLINFGRVIDLQPYFELNDKDNFEAVRALTDQIQESLEHLTVNVRHAELDQLVKDIEMIYRDELMSAGLITRKPIEATVSEFIITQRIAECVNYYYEHDPQRVRAMLEKINAYKRKLKRLHLRDVMLREKTSFSKLLKANLSSLVACIFGFPAAAYGIVNNFLPYAITERIAKKFLKERTKILTALFLGGGAVFILFYAAQVFLVWSFGGVFLAVPYFLSLPITGFFALAYIRRVRDLRERISFSFFLFTNRYLIGKMRRARNVLISEMNCVKEEYMKILNMPAATDEAKVES